MGATAVLDRDGKPTGEYRYDARRYDGGVANRALELLGKEIGMFIARAELTVEDKRDPAELDYAHLKAIVEGRAKAAPTTH